MFTFKGSPFERGRQHGEARREAIRMRIGSSLPPALHDGAEDRLEILAGPWWRQLRDAAPRVGDELRGISSGASVPLAEIVLLNAFEAFSLAEQVELGGCTSVLVPGPDGAILGQNWDANPVLAASVEVHRHVDPAGMDLVMLASPGGLGWIGMNAAGLAVTTNDLMTPGTALGAPSQAVRRRVLEERDVPAALDALLALRVVGGRAYAFGDAGGRLASAELATEAGAPRVALHDAPTAHTNHALNPDVARWESAALLGSVYPSTHARLARAQSALNTDRPTTARAARRILADHVGYPSSICRHATPGEPTITAAAVVFDCARRTAHVAIGNPCTADFVAVSLS